MERIEFLDQAKGFAIFLMVFAHAIAWNFTDWQSVCIYSQGQSTSEIFGGLIWNIVYSFHMPLFFLIAGYFTPPYEISTKKYLIKRTRRLLIPYIASGIICFVVRGHFGYWFFLSLWQLSVVGCLFVKINQFINKNRMLSIDLVLMLLMYVVLNRSLSNIEGDYMKFVSYIPPYIFGIILARHQKLYDTIFLPIIYTLCCVFFILLILSKYSVLPIPTVIEEILNKCRLYGLPVLGSIITISLFRNISNNKYCKVFNYLGKRTSEIYILHILFVIQIPEIGSFILQQNPITCITLQLVVFSLLSVIAILLSIMLSIPLRNSHLFNKYLFGY